MTCRNFACHTDQQSFTSEDWKRDSQSVATSISWASSKSASAYLHTFWPLLLGLCLVLTADTARERPKWSELDRGETVSQKIKLLGDDRNTKWISELVLDEKWVGASTNWISGKLLVTMHNLKNSGWVVSKKSILKSPSNTKLAKHGESMYVCKTVRRLSRTQ